MVVGRITQLDATGDEWPSAIDIRVRPEVYHKALGERIEELEAGAEAFARTLDAMYTAIERLGESIERLKTQIKDLEYTVWENVNGWDI